MIAADKLDRLARKIAGIFETIGKHAGDLEYSRAVHAAVPGDVPMAMLESRLGALGVPMPMGREQLAAAEASLKGRAEASR